MKYYNLNKLTDEEYANPVLIKVNDKTQKMLQRIVKIVIQHRQLESKIIDELAKINNLETYEINDLLADHDFLCDIMEYGNAFDGYSEARQIFNIEEKFHLCDYCYNYWLIKLEYFTRELPSHKTYFKLGD